MKRDNIFRLTEKLLFSYPDNLARLKILCEDIRVLRTAGDVKVQNYHSVVNFCNTPSDPVASHVEKILELEKKIKKIMLSLTPVNQFLFDFTNSRYCERDKKSQGQVLVFFYFMKYSLREVAEHLHVSVKTVLRIRRRIVYQLVGYVSPVKFS